MVELAEKITEETLSSDNSFQIDDRALKIFGYLSFIKAPFILATQQGNLVGYLQDLNTTSKSLTWNIPDLLQFVPASEVKCEYTYNRIRYQITLTGLTQEEGMWKSDYPSDLKIISSRHSERYAPKKKDTLKGTLTISSLARKNTLRKKTILCSEITDLSEGGIGLLIDRKNGLLLPGDRISEITVKNVSSTLLSSSGIVVWAIQNDQMPHLWKLGIKFDSEDPNASPIKLTDEQFTRRYLDRISLHGGTSSAFIKAEHPFKEGLSVSGVVYDISTHGCSFINDDPEIFLPIGTLLKGAMIQLPFSEMKRVNLVLRHISSFSVGTTENSRSVRKYGFEFQNIDKEFFRSVESIVMEARNANLKDALPENADELWRFFFETGFIYDEKRRQLAPYAQALQDTYKKLLKSSSKVMKTVLYKKSGKIYAHNTALALYDRTWLVQHLAALKDNGKSTSADVVLAVVDFFINFYNELGTEIKYVQFYFRPNNPYPALIFGNATQLINNPQKVSLRKCHYLVGKSKHISGSQELKFASDKDLHKFEKLTVATLPQLQLRSEGLFREEILIPLTSKLYREVGIERTRSVLFNEDLGFAVLEKSGPGLNFSEFTNAIKLFPSTIEKVSALADAVANWSFSQGNKLPLVLLIPDNQFENFKSETFVKKTEYMCWTLDLETGKEFKNAVLTVFENLRKLKSAKQP